MKWQEVVGLIRFTEAEFQELEQFMLSQYGIDLSKKRTLSECRLSAELEKEGITACSSSCAGWNRIRQNAWKI